MDEKRFESILKKIEYVNSYKIEYNNPQLIIDGLNGLLLII